MGFCPPNLPTLHSEVLGIGVYRVRDEKRFI